MKIACITSSAIPSLTANSIQVMKTCNALAQLHNDVYLWAPGRASFSWKELSVHYGLTEQFDIFGVPSFRWCKRYDFAIKALRKTRAWKADLVYTWLFQAAVMALYRNMPVILEMHDMPTGTIGPHLFRCFVRSKRKKRLLSTTRALYDKLRTKYCFELTKEEFQIAPNGTEMERYSDLSDAVCARQLLGLPERLTIGYTGHFYQGRGVDFLLKLVSFFPDVQFLFVGGQPEAVAALRHKVEQQALQNIHVVGFVENARLPLYQAACDILAMPHGRFVADSGGNDIATVCSPMKMFDYLATGRAIICSDLSVLHEVLNEDNALFCPPEDMSAWKAALALLIAEPHRRRRLAEQAKKTAARYSLRQREQRALEGF